MRQGSRPSFAEMKTRAESLRATRENERQTLANDKLYEHWLTNDPQLRSIERDKLQHLQPEHWAQQINDKRYNQQQQQQIEAEYEEERRRHLDEQQQIEQDKEQQRKRRIEQLRIVLQQQINELKQKEEEVRLFNQTNFLTNTTNSTRFSCKTQLLPGSLSAHQRTFLHLHYSQIIQLFNS